ncbi:hypothetical protein IWQ60_011040 [Tieghemiomyces parasiticus]|uniref:Uncharacterized protein n=1 Tax=Tieghemiomyces parasiticus TaxID=78921 RepID=A0A9W7ZK82_9FUNG|nr:hypothetical protein IWQ60_011040 [Tieghemiomyces parasiticus]
MLQPVVIIGELTADEASSYVRNPVKEIPGWKSSLHQKHRYRARHILDEPVVPSLNESHRLTHYSAGDVNESDEEIIVVDSPVHTPTDVSDTESLTKRRTPRRLVTRMVLDSDSGATTSESDSSDSDVDASQSAGPPAVNKSIRRRHILLCKPWHRLTRDQQATFLAGCLLREGCVLCTGPDDVERDRTAAQRLNRRGAVDEVLAQTRRTLGPVKHLLTCQTCGTITHRTCAQLLAVSLTCDATADEPSVWVGARSYLEAQLKDATPLVHEAHSLRLLVDRWTCMFCRAGITSAGQLITQVPISGIGLVPTDAAKVEPGLCAPLMHTHTLTGAPPLADPAAAVPPQRRLLGGGPWFLVAPSGGGHSYRDLFWLPYGQANHLAPMSVTRLLNTGAVSTVPRAADDLRRYFTSPPLTPTPPSDGGETSIDPATYHGLYLGAVAPATARAARAAGSDLARLAARCPAFCCPLHAVAQTFWLTASGQSTRLLALPPAQGATALGDPHDRKLYTAIRVAGVVSALAFLAAVPAGTVWLRRTGLIPEGFLIDHLLDLHTEPRAGGEGQVLTRVYVKWQGLPYDRASWILPPGERDPELPRFHAALVAYATRYSRLCPKAPSYHAPYPRLSAAAQRAVEPAKFREFTAQPDYLSGGTLLPYQLDGLNWLCYQWHARRSCILADEMGLGKTIQIIAFVASLFHSQFSRARSGDGLPAHLKPERIRTYPFLIVVPNSVLNNWVREFNKWAPSLEVVAYHGTAECRTVLQRYELSRPTAAPLANADRTAGSDTYLNCHVVVTTYEMFSAHTDTFRGMVRRWPCVVVDEGHRLKNDTGRLYTQLHRVPADQRILLTGTVLNNNIRELFNLMAFLDQAKFGDVDALEKRYADLDADRLPELHEMLQPYLLRRTKAEVLTTAVPPKSEVIVPVTMTALQRQLVRATLARNRDLLISITRQIARSRPTPAEGDTDATAKDSRGPSAAARTSLHNVLMVVRQILNHPYIVPDVEPPPAKDPRATQSRLIESSAKLRLLHTMLGVLRARGHRILLFSQMTRLLDVVDDYLFNEGIPYLRIDGSVTAGDRQRAVDLFNAPDSPYQIMLLTTRAGGVGLNLASADVVIIYDMDFNPHADLQAISRAHRLGQTKPVMVFKFVTRDSAEERIVQLAKQKMILDHLIIEKMDVGGVAATDLASILQYGAQALFEEEEEEEGGGKAGSDTEGSKPEDSVGQAKVEGSEPVTNGGVGKPAPKKRKAKPVKEIRYTEADVRALLDRTQAELKEAGERAEGEAAATQSTHNLFAFTKVWVQDTPDQPSAGDGDNDPAGRQLAGLDALDAPRSNTPTDMGDGAFWERLLQEHEVEAQAETEQARAEMEARAAAEREGRRLRNVKRVQYFESRDDEGSGRKRQKVAEADAEFMASVTTEADEQREMEDLQALAREAGLDYNPTMGHRHPPKPAAMAAATSASMASVEQGTPTVPGPVAEGPVAAANSDALALPPSLNANQYVEACVGELRRLALLSKRLPYDPERLLLMRATNAGIRDLMASAEGDPIRDRVIAVAHGLRKIQRSVQQAVAGQVTNPSVPDPAQNYPGSGSQLLLTTGASQAASSNTPTGASSTAPLAQHSSVLAPTPSKPYPVTPRPAQDAAAVPMSAPPPTRTMVPAQLPSLPPSNQTSAQVPFIGTPPASTTRFDSARILSAPSGVASSVHDSSAVFDATATTLQQPPPQEGRPYSPPLHYLRALFAQVNPQRFLEIPFAGREVVNPPDLVNYHTTAVWLFETGQVKQSYNPCPACRYSHTVACNLIYRRSFHEGMKRTMDINRARMTKMHTDAYLEWYNEQYTLHTAKVLEGAHNLATRRALPHSGLASAPIPSSPSGPVSPASFAPSPMIEQAVSQAARPYPLPQQGRPLARQQQPQLLPPVVQTISMHPSQSLPSRKPIPEPALGPPVTIASHLQPLPEAVPPQPAQATLCHVWNSREASNQHNNPVAATPLPDQSTLTAVLQQYILQQQFQRQQPPTQFQPPAPVLSIHVNQSGLTMLQQGLTAMQQATTPSLPTSATAAGRFVELPSSSSGSSPTPHHHQHSNVTPSRHPGQKSYSSRPIAPRPMAGTPTTVTTASPRPAMKPPVSLASYLNVCDLCGAQSPNDVTSPPHKASDCPSRRHTALLRQRVADLEADTALPQLVRSKMVSTARIYLMEAETIESANQSVPGVDTVESASTETSMVPTRGANELKPDL